MSYHLLNADGSKNKKRVGRGISAGQGKTAGRGTKGQKARTGKKISPSFMGGQGPLVQRIPKARGFKSLRAPAQVVYLDQLNDVTAAKITNQVLAEAGLIATPHHSVKIIARGELSGKKNVVVQGASASVVAAIEKAGGTFETVAVPLKVTKKTSK